MLTIQAQRVVELRHRAYHFRAAQDGSFVAASRSGELTLVARGNGSTHVAHTAGALRGLAIDQDGSRAALLRDADVAIIDLDGRTRARWPGAFDDAWFAAGGDLWTLRSDGGRRHVIEARHCETGAIGHATIVPDTFGGSSASLHFTRSGEPPSLWLAAGQDGQEIHWLTARDDGIRAELLDGVPFTTPPAVRADGVEFLLVEDSAELTIRNRADGALIDSLLWPFEDDESIGTDVYYVSDDRALAATMGGRLFLVDLREPAVGSEVCIAGHEPRPVRELYPRLDEDGLASDFQYMVPCAGGQFLSVHGVLPSSGTDRCVVISWNARDLLGQT